MIATFHLKLVDFASQTFVDYVGKFLTLSTTVRAALLVILLKPSVQTRFTEVLATAYSQVRFTENFGADLTNETIGYLTNKLSSVVSTLLLSLGVSGRSGEVAEKRHRNGRLAL